MAKMKVFELKNFINNMQNGVNSIESRHIQEYLEKNLGVKKTHSSNLEENEIAVVKKHFISRASKPEQPTGQKPTVAASQRPAGVQSQQVGQGQRQAGGTRQGTSVTNNQRSVSQRTTETNGTHGQQTSQGQRQQGGMRQRTNAQNNQNMQETSNTGSQRSQAEDGPQTTSQYNQQDQRNTEGTRSGNTGTGGQSQRPQGGTRPNSQYNQQGQRRPAGSYGQQGQRPQGQNDNRTYGQGGNQSRPRPTGQGNTQGNRTGGYNAQGNRTGGYNAQGNRSGGYNAQGNRTEGNSTQGNRTGGYNAQGNRTGGYNSQGNRTGGYNAQGNRSEGNSTQGNRTGGYNAQGNRTGGYNSQGNRTGGYNAQGNRTEGNSTQGNRTGGYNSQGNRTGGYNAQGARTGGSNTQGNRTGGYNSQGNRTGGYNSQGNRSGGYSSQGNRSGGYRTGGYNKDEDTSTNYNNRPARGGNKTGPAGRNERKTFDQQILDQKVAAKNDNSNKRNRDRMNKERNYKDRNGVPYRSKNANDNMVKLAPKKGQFIKPKPIEAPKEEEIKVISVPEVLTIKELSDLMKKPAAAVVKKLFLAGKMVSINSEITYEEAEEIALEYDIIAEKEVIVNEVEEILKEEEEDPATLSKRPPVVCVMGHVDHGKTSLLDAIRKTSVTSKEAGGITQAIGAYVVEAGGQKITFLDTPGHEAFTSMRMRGAKATDIAILVVAADDGVMPQTVEAISHAKAAGVQIIVAINKIDKPSANIERVKQELTEHELIAEDWGGDTIFVPVSAHTGDGINQLLEMILLASEMMELKANPDRNARGVVIEAKLDKGRGPVATILVQKGTLNVGDNVAVGSSYGKVRAMVDDRGRRVKLATPSTPVEIIGLNEVPDAGEIFMATDNEKEARNISETFITQSKEKLLADTKARLSLDGLFSQIKAGNIKELNLIIKADVQGSVEAMKQSLVKLSNDEVAVRVIHGGVGAINESDVILASTSNAIIIGFNVKPDNAAKDTANREKVDIKQYRVIYNAIDDVEAAMKGMLDPIYEEKVIGHAEIRQTFKASGIGTIAGSYVLDGKITRGCKARVHRGKDMIFEGELASLKRFQDDVKEVATGYECGLVFEKFNDLNEGDKVELYIMAEVPR